MSIELIIGIIAVAGIGYIAIHKKVRFEHQKKALPNIVYRIRQIFYPSNSRQALIFQGVNLERKKEDSLIKQKNIELRKKKKPLKDRIKPVKSDAFITKLSIRRCDEMDRMNRMDHTQVGDEFIEMDTKGLDGKAEILTYDLYSAESTVAAWMRSPEHKKIILDPKYDVIGVGCKRDEFKNWIDDALFGDEKTIN